MAVLSPVPILQQRIDFLEGIGGVARDCGWSAYKVRELLDYLSDELIDVDNTLYDVYEQTGSRKAAFVVWESRMEDLRHWLSMVLGVKIKYV